MNTLPTYAAEWLTNNPYQVVSFFPKYTINYWDGSLEECQRWIETDEAKEFQRIDKGKMKIIPNTEKDAKLHFNLF